LLQRFKSVVGFTAKDGFIEHGDSLAGGYLWRHTS
jgi:hypothetical protein